MKKEKKFARSIMNCLIEIMAVIRVVQFDTANLNSKLYDPVSPTP